MRRFVYIQAFEEKNKLMAGHFAYSIIEIKTWNVDFTRRLPSIWAIWLLTTDLSRVEDLWAS